MTAGKMLRGSIPAIVVALLLTATSAFAQFNASLSGTVEDSAGAVVPGATVTLTAQATQEQKTTTSSASGFYRFSELPPGQYSVMVAANGFEGQTFSDIGVAAETPRGLDIKLTVGKASTTVTVSADQVPLLQTEDASISTTITSEDVLRQPIFGRDPYELVRLGVGTIGDGARSGSGGSIALPNSQGPGQSNFGIFQTENQIQVSAAGQRLTSNSFLIDGVAVDSLEHGGSAVVTPNPESVNSISVTSSDYDATDGRNVGAQIKTVTRAGGNDLHGSLFFQYDEPGLNASSAFTAPSGSTLGEGSPACTVGCTTYSSGQAVQNKQREWAGSLGGPIIKDKLFWFASYEGVSNSNTNFGNVYIPSPEFRSSLATARQGGLVEGALTAPGGAARVLSYLPGDCGNIQGSHVGSTAPTYINGYEVCNPVGDGFDIGSYGGALDTYLPGLNVTAGVPNIPNWTTGNGLDGIPDISYALVGVPARFRGNQFNGRADWIATRSDQLALSFYTAKLDQTSGDISTGGMPQADIPFKPFNTSGTLVYIHTFSPSMLNELRGNFTRFADNGIKDSAGLVNWGIPRNEVQNYNFGRLYANANTSPDTPAILAENTYEVRDTVTKVMGSHTIRAGFQLRFEQDNDNLSGLARPDYVFQGMWNWANDAPIFEQIAANPNTGGVGNAARYFRDRDFALFVQHDWKVLPNLTINAGLRWEYFEPLYNKTFETNNMQFGPSGGNELILAKFVPVHHLYNSNNANIGPKFGFAWQPTSTKGKMVVRGGFGLSYDRIDDILFGNSYENGPGYFLYGLCCAGFPNAAGSGITFVNGTSDSPFSYPANPNLATGVNPVTNTPNAFGGYTPEIETYSASARTPQPMLYSYSLEDQVELPYQMTFTLGYQGSVGHHFPRLVDQNFLYPTASGTCLPPIYNCTVGVNQTPFYAAYIPTTDIYTSYNGVNAHLAKRLAHGWNFDAIYTFAKSLDQGSNEGPGAQSNQTDPADPASEYGPSDFNVKHHVILDGIWTIPGPQHGIMKMALGGWQLNGIYQWHTGFPWTPVTGQPSVAVVQSASTIAPVRPFQYYGGAGNSCSNNSFINGTNFAGGGQKYFRITRNYPTEGPGIGRNSWNGPCYMDTDLSVAKQIQLSPFDHATLIRFQANLYNAFNQVNLAPITFGSPEATVENSYFGYAPGADAGRVIDFLLRIQF